MIKELLKTATIRQSALTTVSTLINATLGALFYFLLAKYLGPGDFGIFTLFTNLVVLLIGIVDLGSDQGIVRFIPKYKFDLKKQRAIIKLLLKIKIIMGTITVIVLSFSAKPISDLFLNRGDFNSYLPLVGIGVLAQILFSFSTSLSQALEKFTLWSALFIGTNLSRLIVILFLVSMGLLNAHSSIFTFIAFPMAGFFISLLFLDRNFLSSPVKISYFKELFGFNKWVLAFVVVATIGSRIEILFTTRYLGFVQLGIYGLALQIANILPQLTGAIGAVTSPKFASFTSGKLNQNYTLKATLLTTAVAALCFIILIPIGYLILGFSGSEYLSGMSSYIVLTASMAIFMATSPIRDSILYYFSKPQFFFWMGILHAAVVTLSSINLIPSYNILGSAIVVLIGQVFIAVTSILYYFHKIKDEK